MLHADLSCTRADLVPDVEVEGTPKSCELVDWGVMGRF